MGKSIAVLWDAETAEGRIRVARGTVAEGRLAQGRGGYDSADGAFSIVGKGRLELTVEEADPQDKPAIVTVDDGANPFSFFLRDVDSGYPVFIPAYRVAVTAREDGRDYARIAADIASRGQRTLLQRMAAEPEESYEDAAAHTQSLVAPTWLGLSRDVRLFEIGFRGAGTEETHWDWVQPRFHGQLAKLPETGEQPVRYRYLLGRGIGCAPELSRELEKGCLPIVHAELVDDDVRYRVTSFAAPESGEWNGQSTFGTHYLVADGYGIGHMLNDEQKRERAERMAAGERDGEAPVLYIRAEATNTAAVPRYAWFRNVEPNCNYMNNHVRNYAFDGKTGFVAFSEGRVCCVTLLNGRPLALEETAVLLKPGETAVLDFRIPHAPISAERASLLGRQDFAARREQCAAFWRSKLDAMPLIALPERRLERMLKAGLLHLDLVAYGEEPHGTLVPAIGMYTAIGSESSPIVQFMDSMGWHRTAERALQFFLDKQHEDGLIQNFGGYMLETGAALWSFGEHYRYTRDAAWLGRIKPKLLKAYAYIAAWRERNRREELRGGGYGLLDGKTADPEDPYRSFMLNGYAYLGLSRLAEMLADNDDAMARQVAREADGLKRDITDAFAHAMAESPAVPIGDGSWVPTAPPWVGYPGPVSLYGGGGKSLTHGSFVARDSMLGPLYLVFQEIIDPQHPFATFMLQYHNELMCTRNVAFSQPYYSIHPWIHLKRGETKAFLKAYYNGFAGLADRSTYTFWEHHFGLSPHKTHEEAWFLMQTRWMLYLEEGDCLRLLAGIPRRWLASGETIELGDVATYFGPFSLRVESRLGLGSIVATLKSGATDRKPSAVTVRLPHPQGLQPVRVDGGVYDPAAETVTIEPFGGSAVIELYY